MNRCFNCGYMWADCNENGETITKEYCHYEGPDGTAPCEQDEDIYEEVDEIEIDEDDYEQWCREMENEWAQTQRELEEEWEEEYGL